MKIEEICEQEMYALFSPDGNIQGMTLAFDPATCLAIIKMLHNCGMSESLLELSIKGFEVIPIKVTILQTALK